MIFYKKYFCLQITWFFFCGYIRVLNCSKCISEALKRRLKVWLGPWCQEGSADPRHRQVSRMSTMSTSNRNVQGVSADRRRRLAGQILNVCERSASVSFGWSIPIAIKGVRPASSNHTLKRLLSASAMHFDQFKTLIYPQKKIQVIWRQKYFL